MNEVKKSANKTPIEMLLGVDEKGRTTARKLYEFLELAKGQFSRWAKANITDNQFAEEGIDYEGFDIDVEGNSVKDYYLTAAFAKKLSMTAKNEKGEQARDYFIKVEDGAVKLTSYLNGLSTEMKAILMHDKKIETVISRVDKLENTMTIDYGQQKELESIRKSRAINVLDGIGSNAYKSISKKAFQAISRDFKEYFNINAYNNTPSARFEEAKTYLQKWQPDNNLLIEIERANNIGGQSWKNNIQ